MPVSSRTVTCDIKGCSATMQEKEFGLGFPSWGQLMGIVLNGVPNPMLCPGHLHRVADYVDSLEEIHKS